MNRPTITIARDLCRRLKARGVIVLAFDATPAGDVEIAGSSYGETKAECTALGYVLDELVRGDEPSWVHVQEAIARKGSGGT